MSPAVTSVMPSRCTSSERDPGVEGQAGEDGGLGGGVEALDVGGGVGLGVAQGLRLLDGLGEAGAGGVHLVEHEVGGAVDDAEHAAHVVAGERLADRAQDRDGAGHGRLVVEVDVVGVGGGVERRAVLGEQRLVGGDHRGAVLHGAQDQAAGRLDAADHLDDDVGAGDELLGVRGEQRGVDRHVGARPLRAAHGDADQLELRAHPGGEVVGVLDEPGRDGGPHDAAAEQGDAQGGTGFVRHGGVHLLAVGPHASATSRASRSSMVSRRTSTRERPPRTATTGGRGVWLYWLDRLRQ